METDIIICTMNRLDLLQKTVNHIIERTHSPYRLHIMDDNSNDGTAKYLQELLNDGLVSSIFLSNKRRGRMANRNMATWIAFSDPFVLVDDDILCPKIEPDWLQQSLNVMRDRHELGVLALNHPGALRREYDEDERVAYCEVVGNTFMFIRRNVVAHWNHSHFENNFGVTDEMQRCKRTHDLGYKVGYVKDVFCYHTGEVNAEGGMYPGVNLVPSNWETLEA